MRPSLSSFWHRAGLAGLATLAAIACGLGCSAARSVASALAPKPAAQVTVVNNLSPSPAPVVYVAAAPPPAAPAAAAERPARARRGAALAAIAVGGATGAVVGGLVGAALHKEIWRAALVGTSAGATGGLVVHAVAR